MIFLKKYLQKIAISNSTSDLNSNKQDSNWNLGVTATADEYFEWFFNDQHNKRYFNNRQYERQ